MSRGCSDKVSLSLSLSLSLVDSLLDSLPVCARVGVALHAMGRYREACPILGKALSLQPKNQQIKDALLFAERNAATKPEKR